jgi:hypothetical protein
MKVYQMKVRAGSEDSPEKIENLQKFAPLALDESEGYVAEEDKFKEVGEVYISPWQKTGRCIEINCAHCGTKMIQEEEIREIEWFSSIEIKKEMDENRLNIHTKRYIGSCGCGGMA